MSKWERVLWTSRRPWDGWGRGWRTFSAKGQMGDTLGFVSYNYSDLLLDKKAAQMIHKRKSGTLMRLYCQKQAGGQS